MDGGLGAGVEFVLAAGVEFAPFVLVVLAVPLELGVSSIRAVTVCADAGIVSDRVGVIPSEAPALF